MCVLYDVCVCGLQWEQDPSVSRLVSGCTADSVGTVDGVKRSASAVAVAVAGVDSSCVAAVAV